MSLSIDRKKTSADQACRIYCKVNKRREVNYGRGNALRKRLSINNKSLEYTRERSPNYKGTKGTLPPVSQQEPRKQGRNERSKRER